ncbi:hypothetical protein [Streptomyces fagopyri]|uniref:hypothetical protein n=1 Tax=Streptomyces fagopyri TaxID=2662397 RepID=UPI00380B4925
MSDWTGTANEIDGAGGLFALVAKANSEIRTIRVAISRAAWGALNGRAWITEPAEGESRPTDDEVLQLLDMTVTPPGTTARDAVYRQSLATLITALDAVDSAALGAWLAHVNAENPNRPA